MDIFAYSYGALVVAGGLIGFLKAGKGTKREAKVSPIDQTSPLSPGSIPSLLAGSAFGGLILYGASKVSDNPKNCLFILCVSFVLGAFMGHRFIKSGKFMPAGLITLLSLISFIRYGIRFVTT